MEKHLSVNGNKVPRFFYGTAWKEERTADLTFAALNSGFTAIDTANQRKHYFEEGAGKGLQKFLAPGKARREDIFLQTKFTFARGQDHRIPYDDNDPYPQQVADSLASSLNHLQTDYLDSLVLHGPYANTGICPEDLETWAAMEDHHRQGTVRLIGVSNVSAAQLAELCGRVKIKPAFVQNRCYARFGWDRQVREVCRREGIVYQGFSLLTANSMELSSPAVGAIANRHGKTVAQIVFRFCQQIGMITLTGTTRADHMRQDLDIYGFELSPEEISLLENIAF
jgi:diketogulonate reductase-like aldo/keto reductase